MFRKTVILASVVAVGAALAIGCGCSKKEPFTEVDSSLIDAYRYDAETETLSIRLESGGSYDYAGVDQLAFETFTNVPSMGSYYNQHIKGVYEVTKK